MYRFNRGNAMAYRINLLAYLILFSLLILQVFILLWATKMVARLNATTGRLLAGALFLASYDILVDLINHGLFVEATFLSMPLMAFVFSLVTLVFVFRPRTLGAGLKIGGYFYFLAFFSAGTGLAVQSLSGFVWAGPLASILVILLVGELGWGIVQSWVWQKTLLIPLEINFGSATIRTTAFLDTGNGLRDPLTRVPVVIVDCSVLAYSTDAELQLLGQVVSSGQLADVSQLLGNSTLATKIRLIPYRSLGTRNGLLIGVKPDSVKVEYGGEFLIVKEAVVGIHEQNLSDDGSYGALIHPELIQTMVKENA